ncbi:MAG: glycosyltransferase [Bacteroidota bacterium]|nr:glycosyltransferase [Bacteroidota bacterium]
MNSSLRPDHSATPKGFAAPGEAPDASVPPIRGRDFVVIGLQPWYYEIGSNCKNIATRLGEQNRVLYVNLPVNRKTWHAKQNTKGVQEHISLIRHKGEKIRQVAPQIWEFYPPTVLESINWLPSTALFKAGCYLNNRRLAADIREAMRTLGFRDPILFNDNDVYNGFYLKECLRPSLSIYYMRDFLQGYAYWRRHLPALEPALIRKSDLVVANSTFYAEYCSGYNPRSAYMGQGCNLELFNADGEHPMPEELKGFDGPVIGYVGALDSERLDERVIRIIAEYNPSWNVVLVGPEDPAFRDSSLHALPNVHFLGRRPLASLPAYIAAFAVCMNPQLINPITRGNYPLKIDEYLALGKPVVASLTRAMELFESHTYQAGSPEEYPVLIERALAEDTPERRAQRIAFARTHTWENCMAALYRAIGQYRPPGPVR